MEFTGNAAPKARTHELLVTETGDEVVIYDLKVLTAHRLNATSAFIWKECDGKRTVGEIAMLLGQSGSTSVDERLVWYALKRLRSSGLLEAPYDLPEGVKGLTRERLLKVAGLAAFASIPIVASLTVPSSVMAASCSTIFGPCGMNNPPCCPELQCVDGLCFPT